MNAKMNFTRGIGELAIFLALVAMIGLSSQPAWAQQGKERGRQGGKQRGSQSALKSRPANTPRANRYDKTPRFGTIFEPPPVLPQANSNKGYRRRETFLKNGLSPSAHGGASNPDSWATFPSAAKSGGNQRHSRASNPDSRATGGSTNVADRSGRPPGWRTTRDDRTPSSGIFNPKEMGVEKFNWGGPELDAAANLTPGAPAELSMSLRGDHPGKTGSRSLVESEGWDEVPEDLMFPRIRKKMAPNLNVGAGQSPNIAKPAANTAGLANGK